MGWQLSYSVHKQLEILLYERKLCTYSWVGPCWVVIIPSFRSAETRLVMTAQKIRRDSPGGMIGWQHLLLIKTYLFYFGIKTQWEWNIDKHWVTHNELGVNTTEASCGAGGSITRDKGWKVVPLQVCMMVVCVFLVHALHYPIKLISSESSEFIGVSLWLDWKNLWQQLS